MILFKYPAYCYYLYAKLSCFGMCKYKLFEAISL